MRFFIFLFFMIFLIGCGAAENKNTTTNNKPSNANTAAINADNSLATSRTPEAAATNDAPTLAPILAEYYAALNKKDEAAAKKFLSQSALKYYEDEAKSEQKSWFAFLLESEEPVNEKREIRSEKIAGDTAIAEIKGGSLVNWTSYKFVKENGEWKFASPKDSPELQGIPSSNSKIAR